MEAKETTRKQDLEKARFYLAASTAVAKLAAEMHAEGHYREISTVADCGRALFKVVLEFPNIRIGILDDSQDKP